MKATKKLLVGLLIALLVLFLLCCSSIILTFVYNFNSDSGDIMAIVYLFIHLIILAIAFYLTFKAYLTKSSIIAIIMLDENDRPILKSRVVAIVLASLALVVGIYSTLLVFGLNLPLSFLTSALRHCLMNVGYSVGVVSLFFIFYPIVYQKEEGK